MLHLSSFQVVLRDIWSICVLWNDGIHTHVDKQNPGHNFDCLTNTSVYVYAYGNRCSWLQQCQVWILSNHRFLLVQSPFTLLRLSLFNPNKFIHYHVCWLICLSWNGHKPKTSLLVLQKPTCYFEILASQLPLVLHFSLKIASLIR